MREPTIFLSPGTLVMVRRGRKTRAVRTAVVPDPVLTPGSHARTLSETTTKSSTFQPSRM